MCSRERVAWFVVSVGRAYCIHLLPYPCVHSFYLSPVVQINNIFPCRKSFLWVRFCFFPSLLVFFFSGIQAIHYANVGSVLFFLFPTSKRSLWVVLGVRRESIWECCQPDFSSKYAIVHSIKLMDMLSRWQRWCVPSYFYQNGESFMLAPTTFSEISKVISWGVENFNSMSCIEKRKCHCVVLTGVIIRCCRSVIENISTSTLSIQVHRTVIPNPSSNMGWIQCCKECHRGYCFC